MPCPIVGGLISYLQQAGSLNAWIFDGEIARYDPSGKPINPESSVLPSNFPAIHLYEVQPGFRRNWTMADAYDDQGQIFIQLFAVGRVAVEALMNSIEVLLSNDDNWVTITATLGATPGAGPGYGIISCLLNQWWGGQDGPPGNCTRTAAGELLYRGDMLFDLDLHGAVITGPTTRS